LGDSYATNIVAEGYKIPQVGAPNTAYREPNNRSAILELPWVGDEVARLLEAGCVVLVPLVPRCCNPLTVAYNQKFDSTIKQRLCIDLSRHVNTYVPPDVYKMVTLKEVLDHTLPGHFMSIFDIEKAYHNIRLHRSSYVLVGFSVPDEWGVERFYVFVILRLPPKEVVHLCAGSRVSGLAVGSSKRQGCWPHGL
jgi:hypothetical protein